MLSRHSLDRNYDQAFTHCSCHEGTASQVKFRLRQQLTLINLKTFLDTLSNMGKKRPQLPQPIGVFNVLSSQDLRSLWMWCLWQSFGLAHQLDMEGNTSSI